MVVETTGKRKGCPGRNCTPHHIVAQVLLQGPPDAARCSYWSCDGLPSTINPEPSAVLLFFGCPSFDRGSLVLTALCHMLTAVFWVSPEFWLLFRCPYLHLAHSWPPSIC